MTDALTAGKVSSKEKRKSFQFRKTAEASVKSSLARIQKSDCKKALPYAMTEKMSAPKEEARLKYDRINFCLSRLFCKDAIRAKIKLANFGDGSISLMPLNI